MFSGGAALDRGTECLPMSMPVVVIGGTAVGGGNSTVPGIRGAPLFMFLVVSMLNIYGSDAGFRLIMACAIIPLADTRKPGVRAKKVSP